MNTEQSEDTVVQPVPEGTEQAAGVDTTGQQNAEGSANTGGEQGGEGEQGKQGQSKTQNAKQRLRRKLDASEAEKARLAEEKRQLEERLSNFESKLNEVANPLPERPTRVDFDTEDEYEDAVYAWRREKESREAAKQASGTQPDQAGDAGQPGAGEQPRKAATPPGVTDDQFHSWQDKCDDAADKYADYDDVINNPKAPISPVMAQTIMLDNNGAEVAYHLGKNPNEAARIAALPFAQQVTEIATLSGTFTNNNSDAPDPIEVPRGGTDGYAGKDPEKMSPSEYRDWRRQQGMGR